MPLARLLALIRRKASTPRMTAFEEMREALRPEKVAVPPPKPAARTKIRKRT